MPRVFPTDTAFANERIYDRFELALKSSNPLSIESLVREVDAVDRETVCRELIAIELEYRLIRGDILSKRHYHDRFPHQYRLIAGVFCEVADSQLRIWQHTLRSNCASSHLRHCVRSQA